MGCRKLDILDKNQHGLKVVHKASAVKLKRCADAWRWEYYIKDHLGNIRISFSDLNDDGEITVALDETNEILEENHYYPGGGQFSGPWLKRKDQGFKNKYNYNGKEEMPFTEYLYYGKRVYDKWTLRFGGVDPISDNFPHVSTYNYAENRFPNAIDLHGLQAILQINITQGNTTTSSTIHLNNENVDASSTTYANQGKYGTRGTLTVNHNLDDGSDPEVSFDIDFMDRVKNFFEGFQSYGEVHTSEDGRNTEASQAENAQEGVEIDDILMMTRFGPKMKGKTGVFKASKKLDDGSAVKEVVAGVKKFDKLASGHSKVKKVKGRLKNNSAPKPDSVIHREVRTDVIIETLIPRKKRQR